jgi:hypothetical protein
MLDRQSIREQGKEGRSKTDKKIRPQPGRAMLDLALQADSAPQDRRQNEAQQENPSRRHLILQNVVDVLHDRHGEVSGWILSPENFALGSFRRLEVNADDYLT